jgi:hypothetical protein
MNTAFRKEAILAEPLTAHSVFMDPGLRRDDGTVTR